MAKKSFQNDLYYISVASNDFGSITLAEFPSLLWLPADLIFKKDIPKECKIIIQGKSYEGGSEIIPVAYLEPDGKIVINIDVGSLINLIRHERYHDGLKAPVVSKLPFNYSILPKWVKSFSRDILAAFDDPGRLIDFPGNQMPFVADWLLELKNKFVSPSAYPKYPDGCRAAFTITHDVDDNWIFRNGVWLDRLIGIEKENGFKGAWFCVPENSKDTDSLKGMQQLTGNGFEIGCHGYNHDAKLPIMSGLRFKERIDSIKKFVNEFNIKGFRSEWLYRDRNLLSEISSIFDYDSSVPSVSSSLAKYCRTGCGTCFPYLTYEDLIEIPLSLPMDEDRYAMKLEPEDFWKEQLFRTKKIIQMGGVVNITIHPQRHQSANERSFNAIKNYLKELTSFQGIWKATPGEIAAWFRRSAE